MLHYDHIKSDYKFCCKNTASVKLRHSIFETFIGVKRQTRYRLAEFTMVFTILPTSKTICYCLFVKKLFVNMIILFTILCL